MALSRELQGAAQQLLGRVPTAQELQDPTFMQRLVAAADQSNSSDAGMRQNLDWIDQGMEPAPPVDKPRQQASAPMRSGKGDRLDARPSSEAKQGSKGTSGVSSDVGEVLPPRRPTYIAGTAEGEVAPASPNAGGSKGVAGPTDDAPSNTPSLGESIANSPAAKAWDWVSNLMSGGSDKAAASAPAEQPAPQKSSSDDAQSEGSYRDIASRAWNEAPSTENVRALGRKMVESDVPQDAASKLAAAGINPAELSYGDKLRMQTMGVDRWIAEQTDQRQRSANRRMSRATDKNGR